MQGETVGKFFGHFIVALSGTHFSPFNDDLAIVAKDRLVSVDPTRRFSGCLDFFDFQGIRIQPVNWSLAILSRFPVTQTSDEVEVSIHQGRRVKIRRGEHFWGIPVNIERSVGMVDDHIVIDTEVRVVMILVFSRDFDDPSVRQEVD